MYNREISLLYSMFRIVECTLLLCNVRSGYHSTVTKFEQSRYLPIYAISIQVIISYIWYLINNNVRTIIIITILFWDKTLDKHVVICNAEIAIRGVDCREIISCKSLRSHTIRQLIRRPVEHMDQPAQMITSLRLFPLLLLLLLLQLSPVSFRRCTIACSNLRSVFCAILFPHCVPYLWFCTFAHCFVSFYFPFYSRTQDIFDKKLDM
ncbi:hypothetical protein AGLY_014307 [Aphis glycines]|uniref:Uncharacterized protein n=1 Tax=Aphis glycines TaxID=307491 RepID=A0A6G0T3U0_APHGL|nr:hypothetical protein AGLY_014307 [Aphis glycines]